MHRTLSVLTSTTPSRVGMIWLHWTVSVVNGVGLISVVLPTIVSDPACTVGGKVLRFQFVPCGVQVGLVVRGN